VADLPPTTDEAMEWRRLVAALQRRVEANGYDAKRVRESMDEMFDALSGYTDSVPPWMKPITKENPGGG
jgi:hypothetical protein